MKRDIEEVKKEISEAQQKIIDCDESVRLMDAVVCSLYRPLFLFSLSLFDPTSAVPPPPPLPPSLPPPVPVLIFFQNEY